MALARMVMRRSQKNVTLHQGSEGAEAKLKVHQGIVVSLTHHFIQAQGKSALRAGWLASSRSARLLVWVVVTSMIPMLLAQRLRENVVKEWSRGVNGLRRGGHLGRRAPVGFRRQQVDRRRGGNRLGGVSSIANRRELIRVRSLSTMHVHVAAECLRSSELALAEAARVRPRWPLLPAARRVLCERAHLPRLASSPRRGTARPISPTRAHRPRLVLVLQNLGCHLASNDLTPQNQQQQASG